MTFARTFVLYLILMILLVGAVYRVYFFTVDYTISAEKKRMRMYANALQLGETQLTEQYKTVVGRGTDLVDEQSLRGNYGRGDATRFRLDKDEFERNFQLYKEKDSGFGLFESRLIDNNDGTISDPQTGYVWTLLLSGRSVEWDEAMRLCESLALGDYEEWSIPSVAEMIELSRAGVSLVNEKSKHFQFWGWSDDEGHAAHFSFSSHGGYYWTSRIEQPEYCVLAVSREKKSQVDLNLIFILLAVILLFTTLYLCAIVIFRKRRMKALGQGDFPEKGLAG